MPDMKRAVKDSVFTYLFSDPKYARELYLYLHPEDTDIKEDDCKLVTIRNVLSNGQYNDLGLLIRDVLIILSEAQSTFSPNVSIRALMYMADSYKKYISERKLRLYSSTAVKLPKAELYMVYTGHKKDIPDMLRLSDLCGGDSGDIEVTVKVLRGGDNSIVGQYVEFCKIADEQRVLYGLTKKAIQETVRICLERGILVPFLTEKQEEIVDIMDLLYDQENIWDLDRQAAKEEGEQIGEKRGEKRGRQAGIDLMGELLKHLEPLGRVSELIAATADKAKLSALAREFGLSIERQSYLFEQPRFRGNNSPD